MTHVHALVGSEAASPPVVRKIRITDLKDALARGFADAKPNEAAAALRGPVSGGAFRRREPAVSATPEALLSVVIVRACGRSSRH